MSSSAAQQSRAASGGSGSLVGVCSHQPSRCQGCGHGDIQQPETTSWRLGRSSFPVPGSRQRGQIRQGSTRPRSSWNKNTAVLSESGGARAGTVRLCYMAEWGWMLCPSLGSRQCGPKALFSAAPECRALTHLRESQSRKRNTALQLWWSPSHRTLWKPGSLLAWAPSVTTVALGALPCMDRPMGEWPGCGRAHQGWTGGG